MELTSRIAALRKSYEHATDAPPVTEKDLVDATKAVADHLEGKLDDKVQVAATDLSMRVGKVIDERLEKSLGVVRQGYDKSVANNEQLRKHFDKSLADMGARYEKTLSDVTSTYQKMLGEVTERYEKRLSLMEKSQETYADFLQKSYESAMGQISDLLKNLQLPTPNVVFSPTMASPEVKNVITMPEQPAPVVNISPEVKSPEVVVNVPPTPARQKTFEYDDAGRPLRVVEKDIEE